jgi:DNA (cytosine-5)-methyltransferase 1
MAKSGTPEFRMAELFCGPGGIALAAKLASKEAELGNIHSIWANDYDADTCSTYKENILKEESGSIVCGDVRKVDLREIPEIDGLSFGFPCNDFSVVGEQKGFDGTFGPLYSYGVKVLRSHKPKWFFAENVGGLRNANEGSALSKILTDLESAGYRVVPHLYKFEEYGVPQARHRIVIVGTRKDLNLEFKVPAPTGVTKTARQALEEIPIPATAFNNELTRQSEAVIERLKHIKPGQNAFTATMPQRLRLQVNGAKISQIYKRLDPNKPAYTITGSGGGGTHVYHWRENRALTNRERARLQSFPDWYLFMGSKESVRKQIGMAVPPEGAKHIFASILKTLAKTPYPAVPANISQMD